MDYVLAQVNIGRLREPLDSPRLAGFVAALDPVNEAADAVLAFKPVVVYPYHYRGKNGMSDVNAFKTLVNAGNTSIDVRIRNWYPGAAL